MQDFMQDFNLDPTRPPSKGNARKGLNVYDLSQMDNVAEALDTDRLKAIGDLVVQDYEYDKSSREDWEYEISEIKDLVRMKKESKDTPFPNSSNIKFPSITNAVSQFYSRSQANLFQGGHVVKGIVTGNDPMGQKAQIAAQAGKRFNYLLLHEMKNWKRHTRNLIYQYCIVGSGFKKIWKNPYTNIPISEYVSAENLVYDYRTPFEDVMRKTHQYYLFPNLIAQRIKSNMYLKPKEKIESKLFMEDLEKRENRITYMDSYEPHAILEQHRFLDLDNDGYWEPYIVTVNYADATVLRIVSRFNPSGMNISENGDAIENIEPHEYFVPFMFHPSPDGGSYGFGFGRYLYSLAHTTNTLTNQIIDSARAATMRGGLIDKRLLGGNDVIKVKTGSYTPIEIPNVGRIQDHVYEYQFPTPPMVLFHALELLLNAQKELAANPDVLSGQSPGANASPNTVVALIEQGQQVYQTIYDDFHSSCMEEIKKIRVEAGFMPEDLDQDGMVDIMLTSDPSSVSMPQKIAKRQVMMGLPGINPIELTRRILEDLQEPDVEKLLLPPEALNQPDPEIEIKRGELEIKNKLAEARIRDLIHKLTKMESEIEETKSKAILNLAKAQSEEKTPEIEKLKSQVDQLDERLKVTQDQKDSVERIIRELANPASEERIGNV